MFVAVVALAVVVVVAFSCPVSAGGTGVVTVAFVSAVASVVVGDVGIPGKVAAGGNVIPLSHSHNVKVATSFMV